MSVCETDRLQVLHALVVLAQQGDTEARNRLFHRFERFLAQAFARVAFLADERGDLLGEAFVVFDQMLRDYCPERGVPFDAYIFALAPHRIYTLARRWHTTRSPTVPPPEMSFKTLFHPPEPSVSHEDSLVITEVLDSFPILPRQILWLHACGHTFPEIADVLQVHPATVRQTHARYLRKLHRKFVEE